MADDGSRNALAIGLTEADGAERFEGGERRNNTKHNGVGSNVMPVSSLLGICHDFRLTINEETTSFRLIGWLTVFTTEFDYFKLRENLICGRCSMHRAVKYICQGHVMESIALHGSRAPGNMPPVTNASSA